MRKTAIFRRILSQYCTRVAIDPLSIEVAFLSIFRAGAIPLCALAALFPSFAVDFRAVLVVITGKSLNLDIIACPGQLYLMMHQVRYPKGRVHNLQAPYT